MPSPRRPRVLMVTGAYFPELSGGGLQARGIVRALAGQAEFAVLTTSTNPALPANAVEEGVSIRRGWPRAGSAARSSPSRRVSTS